MKTLNLRLQEHNNSYFTISFVKLHNLLFKHLNPKNYIIGLLAKISKKRELHSKEPLLLSCNIISHSSSPYSRPHAHSAAQHKTATWTKFGDISRPQGKNMADDYDTLSKGPAYTAHRSTPLVLTLIADFGRSQVEYAKMNK